jgi:penicillin amidase
MMIGLLAQPNSPWFDDASTPQVETRDDIARRSLSDAVNSLSQRYGNNPDNWTWGRLHTVSFVDLGVGQVPFGPLQSLINTPPMPARGEIFTVDASAFAYNDPFTVIHGASMRTIMDPSNWDQSVSVHSTGQSGQLFSPHRDDLIPLWQNVAYHPMSFSPAQVDANARDVLMLTPR